MEAGAYAQEFNRNLSETQENEVLEELKAKGVTVIDVTDKAPWQEATADVVAENIVGMEDVYQQIVDMK